MIREESEFTDGVEYVYPHFQSGVIINIEATDEEREYEISVDRIQERLQEFNQNGSNWRFNTVISLDIHTGEFRPLRGSSYIKLSEFKE